jgi:ornithine decarboxylase
MRQVIRAGAIASDIIYAHPCKSPIEIRAADRLQVPTTVVDSPEEVEKLRKAKWSGGTLIRLLVPDEGSAQPFSKKFGAPLAWVPEIVDRLRDARIPLHGWSFHVGSVCGDADQYRKAVSICAEAAALSRQDAAIVDVGGGFVADTSTFADAADALCAARNFFPKTTRWIGEPGRFFAGPAAHLMVQVSGVKRGLQEGTGRYTLDESIYGAFSNIPFDGFRFTDAFHLDDGSESERPLVKATIYGRTCDSADLIAENVLCPELRVGDWLRVDNMGAYTVVSGSEFNGFKRPKRLYEE